MSNSLEFSAAIFDLDGTLLYTLEEIAAATNGALARLGYPEHPVSAYCRFVGGGAKKLAWRALPEEKQCPETQEALYTVLIEEFERVLNTLARPYDGVLEMLAAFSAAGKQLAILSNKPDELTKNTVAKLLPGVDFLAVQGGLADVPLKPVPDSALAIAAMMNLDPAQIIFVGDSDVDIQTARNSGMIPVGAAWGFRGAEELKAAGASIVLDAPAELQSLLA
ncbi:HAD family hydrolase [Halodesulfovibrio aestuarii]|uniref:phosphoglycolate phosphatase n=1 Tax=Halodesulfovibrio aestuarii TaxID=126333 RepID=A0A8G2C8H5_9BACT|nr:HAD family hydrolase [Halodesulfovibrio aestuarii]SHI81611.1 phosphoglycolate phosphatase [Halodesulfovibrio aestuarii]